MRAHSVRSCFGNQAQRRRHRDDVRERDRERQSGHAGEFRDLNHWPFGVERDAETVPAKTAEEPAARPFVHDPRGCGHKCDQQISPRSRERCRLY